MVRLPIPAHWCLRGDDQLVEIAVAGALLAFDDCEDSPGRGEGMQHDRACGVEDDHLPIDAHLDRFLATIEETQDSVVVVDRTAGKIVFESTSALLGGPVVQVAYLYRDELGCVWRAVYTFRKSRAADWLALLGQKAWPKLAEKRGT